jgi:integrase/recombinase XerD
MSAAEAITAYLEALQAQGRRPHTIRGYRGDLNGLLAVADGSMASIDDAVVAAYVAALAGLAPATRARRLAALRGFLTWATSSGLVTAPALAAAPGLATAPGLAAAPALATSPGLTTAPGLITADVPKDRLPADEQLARTGGPGPVTVRAGDVDAALRMIPIYADRDQLLFGLLARLGLRPGEALALQVTDVDTDEGILDVPGWGGRRRRVLIDDNELLTRIRNWLRVTGWTSGPLFRSPSGRGALRYQSVAERWSRYTAQAGVQLTLGDLRRAHSADLLAGGVPEWVVRDRLGQRTGELPGAGGPPDSADAAVRAWRTARATATAHATTGQMATGHPATGQMATGHAATGHATAPPGPAADRRPAQPPARAPRRDVG